MFLGLKSQLTARLVKALKSEADPASENIDGEGIDADAEPDTETALDEVANISNDKEMEPEQHGEESIDAELDMNDVTIIDEYDSTKPEKVEEPPKKVRIKIISLHGEK